MWGHGYVSRYFSDFSSLIYLKRYRCPICGTVITARPEGFWAYIRSSVFTIYQVLNTRISSGKWPYGFPRQRGGHWLRRLVVNAKMFSSEDLLNFLKNCFEKELHFFT